MSKYIIITGCSQGLGEALAENLLEPGNVLYCISRSENTKLMQFAQSKSIELKYFQFDLAKTNQLEDFFQNLFQEINFKNATAIFLINNAGTVAPITTAGNYTSDSILQNLNINLTAPIIACNEFIRYATDLNIEKRIINISSGAATGAVQGWGAYCSTKAGLNMFSKCVGLEQQNSKFPVKIYALRPGIIDTQMQKNIRASADSVSKKIITLLNSNKFDNGEFIDISSL